MNRGKLYVVGIGPGNRGDMTFRAAEAIRESDVIIGYTLYVQLLENLTQGKKVYSSGMRGEIERCRLAVEEGAKGKTVSLISSGDAGIYGMAGIVLQVMEKKGLPPEVDIIPGVTAASSAASVLGAPLMHDFAVISLSDLLTPRELIEKRLRSAGEGDFVVVLYNPRSHHRKTQIQKARDILLCYRSAETPVGIVRDAGRRGEKKTISTLEKMLECDIHMTTTVIVGNSQSYTRDGYIVTPRGYRL
ncbi:MAG: precorrin-3B C(17)-methyltransferase [Dethiobacter sp.]|nr:MAG: precorrin-3B C(17)-methyltransferase [Dethiobacter sp.]